MIHIGIIFDSYILERNHMTLHNEFVHLETGEVYDGLAVPKKKRYPRKTEFMTMFREGWKYLGQLNLTGEDWKVLTELLQYLDYKNFISIAQETIGENTGLKRQNVTRAIKKLIHHKVIERERDPADKRRWMYRFNADLGWKGDAKQWQWHQQNKLMEQFGDKVLQFPKGIESQEPYQPLS